jgi:hypothetical protein
MAAPLELPGESFAIELVALFQMIALDHFVRQREH